MPIHDWTRVDAGLFHAFHQSWIIRLCDALNAGRLPADYFALPEQSIKGPVPDVLTLEWASEGGETNRAAAGLAVASVPPRTRLVSHAEDRIDVRKASRVAVRHRYGRIVAVVEIISPGNKASQYELRTFVEKSSELIMQGVHLLVVDLFPLTKRDPQGIHKASGMRRSSNENAKRTGPRAEPVVCSPIPRSHPAVGSSHEDGSR